MSEPSYPTEQHDYASDAEELAALDDAMREAPRGALVISLVAVGLLLSGWLILYFFVFIPRGTVG